jgi:hypothetical protein
VDGDLNGERNPKKDGLEMMGDFCREAAVLVLIFATLDKAIKPAGLDLYNLIWVVAVSLAFFVVGVILEYWRKT